MTEFQSHGHGNRRFRAPTNVSDLRKVEKFAGNVKTIENQLLFDEGITAKGLIPAKVLKEDKGDYINALIATRDADDTAVFLEFMTGEMIKTLSSDIGAFLESMEEKILQLLNNHPTYSARKLAEVIGITPKAIEKHLTNLKAEGLILREGPDKGGSWTVL